MIPSWASASLIINEFMADNETGIDDGNNSRQDWIEIFNSGATDVLLDDYYLSDNPEQLDKWRFPSGTTITAGSYLLVFASGDNQPDNAGNPHTNFRLNPDGEFLSLTKIDDGGEQIESVFAPTYPLQFADRSYGRNEGDGTLVFFAEATPGTANGTGVSGVVRDTDFEPNRGFYFAPFTVALTTETIGAEIRYTLDGTLPSPTHGEIYSGPISISGTTNVRAMAWLPNSDFLQTNVDTHTYIFPDQVAVQSDTPEGWPTDWGYDQQVDNNDRNNGADTGIVPGSYGMDQRVVNDELGLRDESHSIQNALMDIPSVSITMRREDIAKSEDEKTLEDSFSLYGTPIERVEFLCSMEYILPDGSRGFQEDCKIETHGNSSRTPWRMQKHSLRLTFSSEVGLGKLRYNLFPDSPVDTFNKLVLRACFTDSWAMNSWVEERYRPNDSLYVRDVWMKETFGAMGQPTSYGNFVHLYLNGLYFGVHNLTERVEDDFFEEHLGGNREDWEINDNFETPGEHWDAIVDTLRVGPETLESYEAVQQQLDIDNYIDYLILHFFVDAEDWPRTNGYAAVNTTSGDGKMRFWVWDQEIVLDKFDWDYYDSYRGGSGRIRGHQGGSIFFGRLRRNPEFISRFADRVYMHLHDGGALTNQSAGDRMLQISGEIDKAIVAESARWGNNQDEIPFALRLRSSDNPMNDSWPPLINDPPYFTREQHWLTERDHIINSQIPALNDKENNRSLISELRARNYYPEIDPPFASQAGNVVPMDYKLVLRSTEGTVYATTDGSDPRLPGGELNNSAMVIAAPDELELFPITGGGWKILDTGISQGTSAIVAGHPDYSVNNWKHPSFNDTAWKDGTGLMATGAAEISLRTADTIFDRQSTIYFRKAFDVSDPAAVRGLILDFLREDGCIIYLNGQEVLRSNMNFGPIEFEDLAIRASSPENEIISRQLIVEPGLLVAGTNVVAVEIHNITATSSDMGFEMGLRAIQDTAADSFLTLVETGKINTRVRALDGEWSALRSLDFIVGTSATAGTLVVSELMFNPQGQDETLEFLELTNITGDTLDLTGVTFSAGIGYTFPTGFLLPPGASVIISPDPSAFANAYPDPSIVLAPNPYSAQLSNGGESLVLRAFDGSLILSFEYDDNDMEGWPAEADGLGRSLVLNDPFGNPDLNVSASWSASSEPGGNPGTIPDYFPSDPLADLDGDGINALAEYYFGTADTRPTNGPAFMNGMILSFPRNPRAMNLSRVIEFSNNLIDWDSDDGALTEMPQGTLPDGRTLENFAIRQDPGSRFIRIRVIQN